MSVKVIFQPLCTQKVDWDDKLEGGPRAQWMRLANEFSLLGSIQVPRCLFAKDRSPIHCQLHGFSDASEKAYAAVIYLKIEYSQRDTVDVRLVASKARVSPIKKQTIPRLELLGAMILARLLNTVQGQLTQLPLAATSYCWTDSFTTLCWIKNERQWKPYVQRRVEEIRSLTDKNLWRFCPGVENPADIPSRSCMAADLVRNDLWWNGPSFLKAHTNQWPNLPTTYDKEMAYEELVKKPRVVTHALTVVDGSGVRMVNLERIIVLEKFGSRLRLLRVTALVIKFTKILIQKVKDRSNPEPKCLSARDLRSSEELWVKSIQQQAFPSEYLDLLHNKKVFLKQLHLFIDERRVIWCRGRLHRAEIPSCSNNPILLPPKHWFTTLLIRYHHQCVLHDGIRETLNSV